MTASDNLADELKSLKKEVASLREDYVRLTGQAHTAGRRQYGLAKDEIVAAIEAIKERISQQAGEAGETISEDVEELRRLIETYTNQTQKAVAAHPLSVLGGALAVGFLLGRVTR